MITRDNYFQTSDGYYIYYEDYGAGSPILLVPGSNCSGAFFHHNVAGLSENHRLILMDPRSQGRSSKTLSGNTLARHADDILELIEYLGLEDVALGGWSLSGSTVVTYCLRHNHKHLSRILLLDSVLFPFSPDPSNTYRYRNYNVDLWSEDRMKQINNYEYFVQDFSKRMSDLSTIEDVHFIQREVRKTLPYANMELHFDYMMTDNESALASVDVPIGLFYAASKNYGTGYAYRYAEIAQAPTEVYTFDKGGHMAFYFDPESYNKCILKFVEKDDI